MSEQQTMKKEEAKAKAEQERKEKEEAKAREEEAKVNIQKANNKLVEPIKVLTFLGVEIDAPSNR